MMTRLKLAESKGVKLEGNNQAGDHFVSASRNQIQVLESKANRSHFMLQNSNKSKEQIGIFSLFPSEVQIDQKFRTHTVHVTIQAGSHEVLLQNFLAHLILAPEIERSYLLLPFMNPPLISSAMPLSVMA
jgi:hypothetical protein